MGAIFSMCGLTQVSSKLILLNQAQISSLDSSLLAAALQLHSVLSAAVPQPIHHGSCMCCSCFWPHLPVGSCRLEVCPIGWRVMFRFAGIQCYHRKHNRSLKHCKIPLIKLWVGCQRPLDPIWVHWLLAERMPLRPFAMNWLAIWLFIDSCLLSPSFSLYSAWLWSRFAVAEIRVSLFTKGKCKFEELGLTLLVLDCGESNSCFWLEESSAHSSFPPPMHSALFGKTLALLAHSSSCLFNFCS